MELALVQPQRGSIQGASPGKGRKNPPVLACLPPALPTTIKCLAQHSHPSIPLLPGHKHCKLCLWWNSPPRSFLFTGEVAYRRERDVGSPASWATQETEKTNLARPETTRVYLCKPTFPPCCCLALRCCWTAHSLMKIGHLQSLGPVCQIHPCYHSTIFIACFSFWPSLVARTLACIHWLTLGQVCTASHSS